MFLLAERCRRACSGCSVRPLVGLTLFGRWRSGEFLLGAKFDIKGSINDLDTTKDSKRDRICCKGGLHGHPFITRLAALVRLWGDFIS